MRFQKNYEPLFPTYKNDWKRSCIDIKLTYILLTWILLAAPIHSYFYFLPCYLLKNIRIQLTCFNFLTIPPVFSSVLYARFEFTSVIVDILRHLVHSRTLCILFWLFQNQIVLSIFFTFCQLLFVLNLQSAERTPGIWSWHKCVNVLLWIKLRTK